MISPTHQPIRPTVGVFDSGFGGLTVLRALLRRLPETHFVYLGDTARLPYGAKSQATVARYAIEAARFLAAQGAEFLVIACNTATALALPEIRAAVRIPVLGVVEPGAHAARSAVGSHAEMPKILVLATAATVASHAYRDTCATLGLDATEMACPLLVPLVEEGWTDHPVTRDVLRIYLRDALSRSTPDAVVLGCTHYPLIVPVITETLRDLGCEAPVVDSAEATAEAARLALNGVRSTPVLPDPLDLFASPATRLAAHGAGAPAATLAGSSFICYATDSVEKFARLGTHFLGQPIPEVHLLDLGG